MMNGGFLMSKYISIAILIFICSVVFLFFISSLSVDTTGAFSLGLVLIFLQSIMIAQLIRHGDILKKK